MALETRDFFDQRSKTGVVIDPVLDVDLKYARISEATTLEPVCRFIEKHELAILFALDTHAHADHMSALQCFKKWYQSKAVIGRQGVSRGRSPIEA
jgi:glyoxylase-like metal-dependent hydrolase (beta-lactamase superfamily II)